MTPASQPASPTRVRLGPGPVHISRVVLGCMFPARLGPAEVARLVHAACDAGITSFDTAPLYDLHRGEEWLGRALRDRRQKVQILTKAGLRWDDDHGRELFTFTDARGQLHRVRTDSRPESLHQEVTASCRRLGTDVLDLVQIHQPDEDTPIASSVEALSTLQESGRLRSFGVSNFSPAQLRAACDAAGAGKLASLQSEYNLLERWPERDLLAVCQQLGVGFLAYSPLAKGVLAGRSTRAADGERASRGSRYAAPGAQLAVRLAADRHLDELAHGYAASRAQVALAWLLAQPGVSAVVVGASSSAQVEDLAKAANLQLSAADLKLLDRACAKAAGWIKQSQRILRVAQISRALFGRRG